ncbi:MAG: hypothetical protein RIQ60_3862 [Pseudomonadota bacterium]|jgi:EAL domain-containing protein (putative c-di-GMP-specific phosphodiesterase class I)
MHDRLIHLIYHSVATRPLDDAGLLDLLSQSRARNAALGVTGMLLLDDENFFQVLEGPQEAVDAVLASISRDARHQGLTIIIREPVAQRAFSDWTLGCTRLDTSQSGLTPGLNDALGDCGPGLTGVTDGRARKLLQAFRDGHWHSRPDADGSAGAVRHEAGHTAHASPATALQRRRRPARGVAPLRFGAHDRFSVAFQPIVDVGRRRVLAYEALVRGRNGEPARSVLDPLRGKALYRFDLQARLHAIQVAGELAHELDRPCQLHLNLLAGGQSDDDSRMRALQDTVDAAARHGLQASQLVLELSETEAVDNYARFLARANHCRSLGVQFALDDFGAGHSGLNLLADFQPETIKLDMHLVRGISRHGPRQAIVRGVLRTCEDLGIDVIAEGVETLDEYHWLRSEGVLLYQGFLFASPGLRQLPRPHYPRVH